MESEKNVVDEQQAVSETPAEQTGTESAENTFEAGAGPSDWADPSAGADPAQQFTAFPEADPAAHEKVLAGFAGAFLFALIGGVLYFLLYQMGYIAGFCGLITFVLASFGYGRFSGYRKGDSVPGLIASLLMMLVVIFLAEYICVAYFIYRDLLYTYNDLYGLSFLDVLRDMPEQLAYADNLSIFLQDLIFAYLLGVVASIGTIVRTVRAIKYRI